MNVDLNAKDHITLSPRNSTKKRSLKKIAKPEGKADLVIDGTGHVIHGEGR